MKASTTGLDIDVLERTGSRLYSLTHPMRIAIIELLLAKERLSVTEIYKHLKIEQSPCSIHLKILKESGVLSSRRDGKKIFYSVNQKNLKKVIDCVESCSMA